MPEPKTYADIRKAECKGCAAGLVIIGMSEVGPWLHHHQLVTSTDTGGSITELPAVLCTAPSREVVIERLLGRIDSAKSELKWAESHSELSMVKMRVDGALKALKGEG